MKQVMLTTSDNPYNPFTNFDEWFAFDEQKGYHTCAYLARIAKTSSNLSDADYAQEVENAIDEILKLNLTGNYVKITKQEDISTLEGGI
jgi:hypothetical protein